MHYDLDIFCTFVTEVQIILHKTIFVKFEILQ